MTNPTILYCHCAYAKVVADDVKQAVLEHLTASGCAFDAVADLCEMSATQDPSLKQLAQQRDLRIAACYPRAVKWLFSAADAKLPDDTCIQNMRTESAKEVANGLLKDRANSQEKPQ